MYPNQNKGISAGVLSGVFWGTPFLVPLILTMFSSIEVAFGRFVFFGLISLLALPGIIRLSRNLSYADLGIVFALSATGFWLYTIVLFYGVRLTNGVISALIVGMLPVTVILFSKPLFNKGLALGLLLIVMGIGALLIVPLMNPHIFATTMAHVHLSGVILLFLALAMWTWFALANSWFFKKHPHIKSMDYSSLMGVISLLCMLPIFMMGYSIHNLLSSQHLTLFIIWSAVLGVGASWISNILWAYCSKNCPPSIYGTLIISETIFGLIYSFIFQHRLPFFNEVCAIILLISGAVVTIRSQR